MSIQSESTGLMTLCPGCLSNFIDAGTYCIKRADRSRVKDICTYCNSRMGYDYYVTKKVKPIRQRKEG